MHRPQNKMGEDEETTNIKDAFKNKQSNELYRYYYGKHSDLISCWERLLHCYYSDLLEHGSSKWLFRGDVFTCKDDSERSLKNAFKTSLDKAFEEFDTPADRPADDSKPEETLRNRIEKRILRSFRRRAHLLTGDKDGTQTHLETFALLRHHGGPARILDWMYSFFPTLYFAVNRHNVGETYTIWALNRKWLKRVSEQVEEDFLGDKDYLQEHFNDKKEKLKYLRKYENNRFQSYVVTYLMNGNSKSFIYAANPYRFNERLVAQRGTLLFSGTVERTWGQNLLDMMVEWPPKKDKRQIESPVLYEIPLKLSKSRRSEFLKRLDEMNINQATLFPDLGGFAESLRTRIAHPESLGIDV